MGYNIYFECSSAALILIIGCLYFTRRSSDTKQSRNFVSYGICAFVTAFAGIFRFILPGMFPQVGLPLAYAIHSLYLISYITAGLFFVRYVDSVAKVPAIEAAVMRITLATFVYEVVIAVTSPVFGLLFTIDESYNFVRGPLYLGNLAIGLGCVVGALVMLERGSSILSRYQRNLIRIFLIVVVANNVIQFYRPTILLGGTSLAIMVLFLYVSFENPAYFLRRGTACQNREAFNRTMRLHIKAGESFGLVIGVVDDYNTIIKTLRTTQKDNLHKAMASRLADAFGRDVFMLDGNHFAIKVLVDPDNEEEEHRKADEVKALFAEKLDITGRKLSISITTVIIPSDYRFNHLDELNGTMEYLLEYASNKNLTDYEKVDMALKRKHRHDEVERCVEKAIKRDGFMVYYQPIFNVETGRFESSEALVRLIDEDLGYISPEEFIPITEECGLIIPLGEQVFRKVCQFINRLKDEDLGVKYIEVNMSPVQCEKHDIADTMFSIMEECNTDPSMINFEITETAEAEFAEGSLIVENIVDMNKRGVGFSIDDFGSGFSAMDHLFSVPVDLVKVDKSILWQAINNEGAMIVLQSTLQMIHRLKKKILVEGVEDQQMVDILKASGCNYMQGYFFSKPISEDEYIEFLRTRNFG